MKSRCYCSYSKDYCNYGARGISVCEEWLNNEKSGTGNCTKGFIAFKEWALANGYTDDLTLDRIDSNKDYCPENCRWVTSRVQENNRRNNLYINYKGKRQSLSDWCRELELDYRKTHRKIHDLDWSIDKAFESD
jgi:hypothetical protein